MNKFAAMLILILSIILSTANLPNAKLGAGGCLPKDNIVIKSGRTARLRHGKFKYAEIRSGVVTFYVDKKLNSPQMIISLIDRVDNSEAGRVIFKNASNSNGDVLFFWKSEIGAQGYLFFNGKDIVKQCVK